MNVFIDKIAANIAKYDLLIPGRRVIVALSGGADSVALLVALSALGYDVVAAHCNFHLRGEESDRDERHARAMAERWASNFEVTRFDVEAYMRANGVSMEMACRELRYDWFECLSAKYGGVPVAVAHHLDDNIETMLLNMLRGSGVAGLAAMQPVSRKIFIRPMLDCRRGEIERFLAAEGIEFVIDSSNSVNDVKRNRLRNMVLPLVRELFADADRGFATTLANMRSTDGLLRSLVAEKRERYMSDDGHRVDLAAMSANESESTQLLYEMLKPQGFNLSQTIAMMATLDRDVASGQSFHSPSHVGVVSRGVLELVEKGKCHDESEVMDLGRLDRLPDWLDLDCITVDEMKPDCSGMTLFLDPSVLDGTDAGFSLRHWRESDRIAPFGMNGTRLVSDLFTDAKLSIEQKKRVWLLTRGEEILWVVGLRGSKHFAVDRSGSGGSLVLRLRVKPC